MDKLYKSDIHPDTVKRLGQMKNQKSVTVESMLFKGTGRQWKDIDTEKLSTLIDASWLDREERHYLELIKNTLTLITGKILTDTESDRINNGWLKYDRITGNFLNPKQLGNVQQPDLRPKRLRFGKKDYNLACNKANSSNIHNPGILYDTETGFEVTSMLNEDLPKTVIYRFAANYRANKGAHTVPSYKDIRETILDNIEMKNIDEWKKTYP